MKRLVRSRLQFRSAGLATPLSTALAFCILVVAGSAAAQGGAQFNNGYGGRDFNRTIDPSTRDADSNQVFVNRLMQTPNGSVFTEADRASRSGGVGGPGTATAIGNNLEVVVVGSWNRVVVDSTQINNGDVSAQTSLNGSIDLE